MMTDETIIEIKGLTRTYRVGNREIPALQGVDLSIPKGKLIALRGRSSSGKTTLLNCMSGLDLPTSGDVVFDGNSVTEMSERAVVELRRRRLGFIFQSHALLPTYSAAENIDLMLRLADWPVNQRKQRTQEVLVQVGMGSWHDHRAFELSGGQQQRVSIARAIACKPDVIFAHEPTGELDVATSEHVQQLFRALAQQEGMTFLIVTHDPLVDDFVDVTYHLVDGRIAEKAIA